MSTPTAAVLLWVAQDGSVGGQAYGAEAALMVRDEELHVALDAVMGQPGQPTEHTLPPRLSNVIPLPVKEPLVTLTRRGSINRKEKPPNAA